MPSETADTPNSFDSSLKDISSAVDSVLDGILTHSEGIADRLCEAMRYALFAGGKRLRPFLAVTTADLFGVPKMRGLRVAAAVEMIHTYSLVHDDLPAMDDDDLRRGQPTCHIRYDEATAILAGDALQALAFQTLADPATHPDPEVRCHLIAALATACGGAGMVGGQILDLKAEHIRHTIGAITRLQRMKTGELIAFPCISGAILGQASASATTALQRYAHDLGLAFQIRDDLLDLTSNDATLGKRTGKDSKAGKATFASIMGVDQAQSHADTLIDQAISHLDLFGGQADMLRIIARFVVNRAH